MRRAADARPASVPRRRWENNEPADCTSLMNDLKSRSSAGWTKDSTLGPEGPKVDDWRAEAR
jgi:hypothetical protein